MERQRQSIPRDDECSFNQPTAPLRSRENQKEAFGMLQVPNEKSARDCQERSRQNGRDPEPERIVRAPQPEEDKEKRNQISSGSQSLRPRIEAHAPVPGNRVCDIVREKRGGRRVVVMRI